MVNAWSATPEQSLATGLALARRAVATDPRDAEAHTMLAFALITSGDATGALEEARRAVDINPSMPWALALLAYVLHMTGHPPEEAIALNDRAMRLSPRDPVEWLFYDSQAGAYWNAGRYAEGIATSRRLIALVPSYYYGYVWGAMNAADGDRLDEAREFIRQGRIVQPELSVALIRRSLGAIGADVDRRMVSALQRAGLE